MSFSHTYIQDKPIFLSEEAVQEALAEMVQDELLDTGPEYVKDSDNNMRSVEFVEKHTVYLRTHPKVNPQNYLANVKTMIRIRQA